MSDVIDYAGEFTLELAEIIGHNGRPINVTGETVDIDIYEDIQNPALHGSIAVNDNFDLQAM